MHTASTTFTVIALPHCDNNLFGLILFFFAFTPVTFAGTAALYEADKNLPLRKSHENPVIKKLYEEYLEKNK